MNLPARATTVIAAFLFFCSGALGLGYELIWVRSAASVVGSSQLALGTVLAAFFVGLASGSYVVGRYVRSARFSPLFLYGGFEAAVGVFALAFPVLFPALKTVYGLAYPLFDHSTTTLFALRFALLFVLFLVPTFFMGGTLPLLLDGLISRDRNIGVGTSALYGIHTLGAVAGVLATSYVAIPVLGLSGTSVAAGFANLLISLAALLLFRRVAPVHEGRERSLPDRFFRTAAFASGLLALAYQICWARYFSLTHFSSIYLTAILLAVYLLAIAAGSFLLVPLLRRSWHPLQVFAILQAFVPIAVLWCLDAWRLAEYRITVQREWNDFGPAQPAATLEIAHDSARFWHLLSETADATFVAPLFQLGLSIALPVLLIGTGLPALITAATSHAGALKSVSGSLVLWNTLGAAAGSFFTGYVLLPLFGLHRTLIGLGCATLALSVAAIAKSRRRWRLLLVGPAIGLALFLLPALRSEDVVRATIRRQQFGRSGSTTRLTALSEGPLTTAYVFEDDATIRIASGAVQMGNIDKRGVNLQVVEGHLPVLFYPGTETPRDCLGICLGTGQSFGALLRYPVSRLDVVEISGEITELARRLLGPYNQNLAADPRVRFWLDDGRHFVERAATASYDIVSMESPPPIADGVYRLYSEEFYREVRRVVRPGGVFMQFMPLYYLSPLDAKSVLKTLALVFPQTFVVKVSPGDYMLLAYPNKPSFSVHSIVRRAQVLAKEWSSRDLRQGQWSPESAYPIASFEGIASMLVMGPEEIESLDAPVLLRDDKLALSYGTGDRWLTRRYMGPLLTSVTFPVLRPSEFSVLGRYFEPPPSPELLEALTQERVAALRIFRLPHPRELRRGRDALARATDPVTRATAALELAQIYDAALQKQEAYRLVEVALESLRMRPWDALSAHVDVARTIVRNQLAVYRDTTERWLQSQRETYSEAPLFKAMMAEFVEYEAREKRAASLYLFP